MGQYGSGVVTKYLVSGRLQLGPDQGALLVSSNLIRVRVRVRVRVKVRVRVRGRVRLAYQPVASLLLTCGRHSLLGRWSSS